MRRDIETMSVNTLIPTIRAHACFCDGHQIPRSRTIASLQSAATAFMKVGDMAHATARGLSSAQSLLLGIRASLLDRRSHLPEL